MRRRDLAIPVVLLGWLLVALPSTAHARRLFRARFEPTTLELEEPGRLEVDLQVGGIYGDGQDGPRLVTPDFEVDLGLLPWLELDVDGGFTVVHVDRSAPTRTTFGEPIWATAKLALVDAESTRTGARFGVGLQLGPRFPSLRTAPRTGFGALLLAGGGNRHVHVVGNFGVVLDRGQSPGIVYGVDVGLGLGGSGAWSLVAAIGGGHYFGSSTPDLLMGTLGIACQVNDTLGLSLVGIGGFLPSNDRLGVIAGLSTSFGLWQPAAAAPVPAAPDAGATAPMP